MNRNRALVIAALAVLVIGGGLLWWFSHPGTDKKALVIYGNVDLRQVDLAFNNSDRIAAVLVQEGDRVTTGQVLARLDQSRLLPQMQQIEAQAEAQKAVAARLHAGERPQEIAEAKAQLEAADADYKNAALVYKRTEALWSASAGQAAVSRQDVDNAKAALDAAEAHQTALRKAYELAVLGPRKEDIDQADAQLRASQAGLAVLKKALADADLIAPAAGVIRSRLMEPGEMASPQRPVFAIAETDPKWVRAYVNEVQLSTLHPGVHATVTVDGLKGKAFKGWVGFISSVAEFTPKTVQTTDLRTSLVYEVRVFVTDPADDLRLGMPATVAIDTPAAKGG